MPSSSLSRTWTQFFPPKPDFTGSDLPDLTGKVYIVTGSNTGIGKEVVRSLYAKNASVYVATRSEQKALKAISEIKESAPGSRGTLNFLPLDLSDLAKVKTAAEEFLSKEEKLHVLFNNAGQMASEPLIRTAQGYEMALGVNCVGTFLFTRLLTPILVRTARASPANMVRVVWLSSFGLDLFAAKDVCVDIENLDYHRPVPSTERYGISKCGTWALGVEFARRHKEDNVISLPINPGNLNSELARDQSMGLKVIARLVGYPTSLGACTELFAAFSPDITVEKTGSWIVPFGRFYPVREDLSKATKTEVDGGTGGALKFWEWCEDQVKQYL